MTAGRRSSFKEEYIEQARKLCELGATDEEVADFIGVSVRTLYRWNIDHPKFCQALKVGKEVADQRVEQSLYHKAVGYSHESVKIFMPAGASEPIYAPYTEHIPPDTTAMIFWLKNRKPDEWRDAKQIDKTVTHKTEPVSEADKWLEGLGRADTPSAGKKPLPH